MGNVDLLLNDKEVEAKYTNEFVASYAQEAQRSTARMQQAVLLGWVIDILDGKYKGVDMEL